MPSPRYLPELECTLRTGCRLPGEPTGKPPWPSYLDDEYRRITAANCLADHYRHRPEAVAALRNYTFDGSIPEVRIRCVTLLGRQGSIDDLIERLTSDIEPELRLFALEYLLTEMPTRISDLLPPYRQDQDWQVQETLSLYDRSDPIPCWYYEPPDDRLSTVTRETHR